MQVEQTAPLQHTQGRVERDLLQVPAAMLEARLAQLQRLAARPPHCCTNLQHTADLCGPQPLEITSNSDGQLQVKAPTHARYSLSQACLFAHNHFHLKDAIVE